MNEANRLCAVVLSALLVAQAVTARAQHVPAPPAPPANVVTADIAAGIERHIEERTRAGGGTFALDFSDRQLRLKLVRIHMEYLANLGPGSHFACVDLVDDSGDVFDVDFFLVGEPGAMKVTETTVHKLNGQPYYLWDQKEDGTWQRITVTEGSEVHLGVTRERDEFEFIYRATLPEIPETARVWLPVPTTDAFQTIEVIEIDVPGTSTTIEEKVHGNRILMLDLTRQDSGKTLTLRYRVQRLEKAGYAPAVDDHARYLAPERLVPAKENFLALAQQAVAGKKTDLVRARALYDHVIERMKYAKAGTGWGKGDAQYACDARTGNCTDFHAYFIALARAIGIPARFAIGAAVPSERNDGGVDGYHCWAEFFAEGKWWPIDISEADKYSALCTYYFGHHPANRVELSRGRDLVVDPAPASGPINFLAYPLLEIAGKPVKAKVEFSFIRKPCGE